jgi:hypothetical protein
MSNGSSVVFWSLVITFAGIMILDALIAVLMVLGKKRKEREKDATR